jgi:uncharacterized protein
MARRRVLVWDAPNIDMTLSQLLGRRPSAGDRPDLRALLRWLVSRREPGEAVEASVFVNVPPERPPGLQSWIAFLTSVGFRVFAKPKSSNESDVDEDMVDHIRAVALEAAEIVVASNDSRRFLEPLRHLSRQGVQVTVLGFAELAGYLAGSPGIDFVDLEDIPGLLSVTLQRVRLDTLPDEGAWFEPRVSPEEVVALALPGEPFEEPPQTL